MLKASKKEKLKGDLAWLFVSPYLSRVSTPLNHANKLGLRSKIYFISLKKLPGQKVKKKKYYNK